MRKLLSISRKILLTDELRKIQDLPPLPHSGAVHQFEGVYWARRNDWDPVHAAMESNSFYDLPPVLRWFSGNIGYHHVRYLGRRIPNYRLKECFDAIPALKSRQLLTLRGSLACIRLKLWDEERQELVAL